MLPLIIAVPLMIPPGTLYEAAERDREQFQVVDENGQTRNSPTHFYLVADPVAANVLRWVLSSTSRQPIVERCWPVPVVPYLYRIDLNDLQWRREDWHTVLQNHPYGGYSLLVRGDWLIAELLDGTISSKASTDGVSSYERLLYGEQLPKTKAEFLKFWGVDEDVANARVVIDGNSPVAVAGLRWIERRDCLGEAEDLWFTRDTQRLGTNSPLERPGGDFREDGSEYIVSRTKFSLDGTRTGRVQYYALAGGDGTIVREAPATLVTDFKQSRGRGVIVSPLSCIRCHVEGIRPLDRSEFVTIVEDLKPLAITPLRTSAEALEALQLKHYNPLTKEQQRATEDYIDAVQMHTGGTPEMLVEAIDTILSGYDAPLSLERAAQELGVQPDLLKEKVLAYSTLRIGRTAQPAPAGMLSLVTGRKIPRALFEESFGFFDALLKGQKTENATR